MDLYWNRNCAFTRWVIEEGLLHEPFVVVDVGCQGGESPRWQFLKDRLELHSFDALSEVIDELTQANHDHPNKHYYNLALGDEDCEREFVVVRDNPYESSFFTDMSRPNLEQRMVTVRTLDTLVREGVIGRADFLKIDVEGFEVMVLRGAEKFLVQSGLLGIETETSLGVSPTYFRTQFVEICDILIRERFLFFDLAHNNWPKPIAQATLRARTGHENTNMRYGCPATFNVLYAIDHVAERDSPAIYISTPKLDEPPSVDRLIKSIILFELYGLCDRALDLLNAFRDTLTQRLDVALAEERLMESITPVQLIDQELRPSLVPLAQEFNISPVANDFFWNLTQWITHGNAAVCEAFLRWARTYDSNGNGK